MPLPPGAAQSWLLSALTTISCAERSARPVCGPAGCWFHRAGKNCTYSSREHDCGTQLVCLRGVCQQCVADHECDLSPEQVCRRADGDMYYVCSHKDMVPPDPRDLTGFGLAFVASALAAGGGIGGGGLLVPLFVLVLAFTPHDATPLSNVAILGGSMANLLLNARRRHPSGLRPLISFEVALMMEPMTIAGALVGCVLNKIFPGWLITILLVLLLGLTARRTLLKGIAAWRKESATATAAADGYSTLSPGRRNVSTVASPFTVTAATPHHAGPRRLRSRAEPRPRPPAPARAPTRRRPHGPHLAGACPAASQWPLCCPPRSGSALSAKPALRHRRGSWLPKAVRAA